MNIASQRSDTKPIIALLPPAIAIAAERSRLGATKYSCCKDRFYQIKHLILNENVSKARYRRNMNIIDYQKSSIPNVRIYKEIL